MPCVWEGLSQRRGQLREYERLISYVRQNGEKRPFVADSQTLNNTVFGVISNSALPCHKLSRLELGDDVR
jgi:hypothetical protein